MNTAALNTRGIPRSVPSQRLWYTALRVASRKRLTRRLAFRADKQLDFSSISRQRTIESSNVGAKFPVGTLDLNPARPSGWIHTRGLTRNAHNLSNSTVFRAPPKSAEGLRGTIGFLRDSGLWSESIRKGLEAVVRDPVETNSQIDALHILGQHAVETDFLVDISAKGASEGLREAAFEILVERQHRPTIERALSELVKDDETLKSGERYPPLDFPLGWIGKIRSAPALRRVPLSS